LPTNSDVFAVGLRCHRRCPNIRPETRLHVSTVYLHAEHLVDGKFDFPRVAPAARSERRERGILGNRELGDLYDGGILFGIWVANGIYVPYRNRFLLLL
jgi:hypothetical protein